MPEQDTPTPPESVPTTPRAPTLPAMALQGEKQRRATQVRPSKAMELGAITREMDSAIHLAGVCGVAVWLLIALTALRASGVFPLPLSDVRSDSWAAQASSPWPRSVQALLLLVVATQLVMVLLVTEHRINEDGARQHWEDLPRWLLRWQPQLSRIKASVALSFALWVLRVLVVGLVAGAIATDLWRRSWWDVVVLGVIAQLLTWRVVRLTDHVTRTFRDTWRGVTVEGAAQDERAVTDDAGGASTSAATAAAVTGAASPEQPFVIGASGGGIRAAAFALGGIHAMQDNASALGIREGTPEPPLFAVSGGSYIGAALALVRRFTYGGGKELPDPAIGWADSYRPGSVELERLRRHTRYLFEPVTRWRDGLVALVLGATLNVVLIGLVLLVLTWVSATLAVLVGMSKVQRSRVDGPPLDLLWASGWSARDWLVLLSPTLACLVGILYLTWQDWAVTSAFDDVAELGPQQMKTRNRVTVWRQGLLALGVAWLVVTAGLPAATKGVTWLTTSNQPTAMAAGVLNGLGFGVKGTCTQAMVNNLQEAVARVGDEARVSPDTERTVDAGACGRQTTVSRTFATQGDNDPSNDVAPAALDRDAAASLGSGSKASLQVGSISGLLLAVIGMLSRGPSPESKAETKLVTRARRWVLTWLPLTIVAAVALYLVLLWTFHYLIELKGPGWVDTFVAWTATLAALACALAYLVNANATSMHSFYRSRLADAFCVGRDSSGGFAEQLITSRVYSFSDLDDVNVNLNVVATLNSKASNETPTMRGGFPVVFGPQDVTVFREQGRTLQVGVKRFEAFAGAGRTSVMAAVAISGAAISPLMGRFNVQMAPYRFLLTLFNLRVGMWVRNPLHAAEGNKPRKRNGLWLTSKPGLAQIALEAVGRLSADDRWIYLSDGGHLDNTALVECVRHCVRTGSSSRVLILDASNDPPDTWSAVGDAIAVIRADLGLDLVRRDPQDCAPWVRRYTARRHDAPDLDVLVVKSVRVEPRTADAANAANAADAATASGTDWNAQLPPNVQSFQLITKDFPRSSTARQKFGDLEFEAYRGLGYACTHQALVGANWIAQPDPADLAAER